MLLEQFPSLCRATTIERQWFALYTTCRHEKRVAAHFEQRGIEHFLPLYVVHRKWRDGSRDRKSVV